MTYSELKSAVQAWLDDSSLDTEIDMFIQLTEAKLNRSLRVMQMVSDYTFVAVEDQSEYTLPDDFLGARYVSKNGMDMSYKTPEQMDWRTYNYTSSPGFYTIQAGNLVITPSTADTDELSMLYYQALPPIGSTNDTNWLLTLYPDAYLYGCLLEANLYLYDNQKAQQMAGAFDNAVAELKQSDKVDRWSGGTMKTRTIP